MSAPINKDNKKKKEKKNGEGFFKRLGRKISAIFSELKKVVWPGFGKVVKQTLVVLGVVIVFAVVLLLIDLGLGELHRMAIDAIPQTTGVIGL